MKGLKSFLGVAIASVMFCAPASAAMVPFDISINFGAGLSVSQKNIFAQAESFWESYLLGYDGAIGFPPGLTITAQGAANDGVGGVLGSAGPTAGYRNASNNILYASTGTMSFDSADLSNMETNGSLLSVIVHEMAHVIGFGTLWSYNNLSVAGSGRYTGQYALAAYRAEYDASATYVPVELDGGAGTANSHWDETWSGGPMEIMTGYLNTPATLSKTTLASFRDLGYVVFSVDESPSDVPVPFIAGIALLGLGLSRRRTAETHSL